MLVLVVPWAIIARLHFRQILQSLEVPALFSERVGRRCPVVLPADDSS